MPWQFQVEKMCLKNLSKKQRTKQKKKTTHLNESGESRTVLENKGTCD